MKHIMPYDTYLLLRENLSQVPELSLSQENVDRILSIFSEATRGKIGATDVERTAFVRDKVLAPFRRLPSPIPVYRILIRPPEELRRKRLGRSWSFDLRSCIEFVNWPMNARSPVKGAQHVPHTLLIATVEPRWVDWDATMKQFIGWSGMLFDDGDSYPENEIVIPRANEETLRDLQVLHTVRDWDTIQTMLQREQPK